MRWASIRAASAIPVSGVREQHFDGCDPGEFVKQRVGLGLGDPKAPCREIDPRKTYAFLAALGLKRSYGCQEVAAGRIERLVFGHRAGGEHADNRALQQSLGRCRIGDLFTDGDFVPMREELAQIRVRGLNRHARHGDLALFVARGEREAEVLGCDLRVVVKHLVEVAHPKEDQGIRVLLLGGVVLGHGGSFSGHDRVKPQRPGRRDSPTIRRRTVAGLSDVVRAASAYSVGFPWNPPWNGCGEPNR